MIHAPRVSDQQLAEAKMWLRGGSSTATDAEITQTYQAALIDLQAHGITQNDPSNALIKQAIKWYCKGNYGYHKDAEKFRTAYEKLRDSLSLSGDFT